MVFNGAPESHVSHKMVVKTMPFSWMVQHGKVMNALVYTIGFVLLTLGLCPVM